MFCLPVDVLHRFTSIVFCRLSLFLGKRFKLLMSHDSHAIDCWSDIPYSIDFLFFNRISFLLNRLATCGLIQAFCLTEIIDFTLYMKLLKYLSIFYYHSNAVRVCWISNLGIYKIRCVLKNQNQIDLWLCISECICYKKWLQLWKVNRNDNCLIMTGRK